MADRGRDVSTVARAVERSRPIPTAFRVEVIRGADVGSSVVVDGPVLVGLSTACGLRLTDPTISRRHLSLEMQGTLLRVTDLESTNGVLVSGLRVVDALLSGGETIEIGSSTLKAHAVVRADAPELPKETSFGRLVGASPAMRRIYPLLERLAASRVPVILEGETGTGKELLAESLHEQGPRARGPFVVFDCTAVAQNLVEAALFGHERGAFTSAIETRRGVFEQADGGTLLIDEIGDLDLSLQAKLLRALERSEIRRIGGDKWIKVDVRILAATRRDLDREVQAGRFRDDLFFRLAVARVELPPLRKRHGDVERLARSFLRRLRGDETISDELRRRLEDYPWPGNVRELHNVVARHVALDGLVLESAPESVPEVKKSATTNAPPSPSDDVIASIVARRLPWSEARRQVLDAFQERYLEEVLERHGGNVSHAAAAAGVARRYFQTIKARQK